MKTCRICNIEKNDNEFYKGLRQCKPCYISKVKNYRAKNIERIREYDRKRGNRQSIGYLRNYREKYPNKYRAHLLVNNAIRDKRLFKKPCEQCGSNDFIHGHHDDYLEPLNVRWLCAICHRQWHTDHGEGLNP